MTPILAPTPELLALLDLPTLTNKQRMTIPCQAMPEQPPGLRVLNMTEVSLGYSADQARLEAARCLDCKTAPCVAGCPVSIDIPGFLMLAAQGNFLGSLEKIREASLLPAICGRVCPQESQCQENCTVGKVLKDTHLAVSIGRVERFVADWTREAGKNPKPEVKAKNGRKVGVIGSGPAGITVAADLAKEGYSVTLFEAFHKPGGVLVYGIPEFRLPKAIVEDELNALKAMGVEIKTNFLIGRTRKLMDLMTEDGYEALFIGSGAGLPKFLGIEGENLVGVFSANEYLTRSNLMKAYAKEASHTPIFQAKHVAVLGGGNVAMDAARTAKRLGAETVTVVYRRTLNELPAREEEVHHAQEEGIEFLTLHNPIKIEADEKGKVKGMLMQKYELGEADASGRRAPVALEGQTAYRDFDAVLVSIGNESNPLLRLTTPELRTDPRGRVIVDENGMTSIPGIYAGGDIVLGAATVILAMGEGRKAAASMHKHLSGK